MDHDIGLSANIILIIAIAYGLAWACLGAAFAFGIIERRNRKPASKPKHNPIDIKA